MVCSSRKTGVGDSIFGWHYRIDHGETDVGRLRFAVCSQMAHRSQRSGSQVWTWSQKTRSEDADVPFGVLLPLHPPHRWSNSYPLVQALSVWRKMDGLIQMPLDWGYNTPGGDLTSPFLYISVLSRTLSSSTQAHMPDITGMALTGCVESRHSHRSESSWKSCSIRPGLRTGSLLGPGAGNGR